MSPLPELPSLPADAEQTRQQALIHAYDRMLVRRAQAALVLKQRGYDLTDLAVLQTP